MDTSLTTVRLGTTDMTITRVGFGAWAVGGSGWAFGWGQQDDDDSVTAIRHAVERGVNWIDTAPVYGLGHSEEVVARALADLPEADRPYVFTKGGMDWSADPSARAERIAEPRALRRQLEDSLRRLDVEQIDLYQVHWPAEDGTQLEEYWQAMLDFKAEGKVRAIGLSNHDVGALERAEALGHVDTLQPPYSAIRRDSAVDLLPWCADHGVGTIVYSPMGSGLLTGAFSAERVAALPKDDWRHADPAFTTHLKQNLTISKALGEVARRHSVEQPAAAVAWVLGIRGVTGAIVGARTPAQVDGWVPGGSLELTDDDYALVAAAGAPRP